MPQRGGGEGAVQERNVSGYVEVGRGADQIPVGVVIGRGVQREADGVTLDACVCRGGELPAVP